MVEATRTNQRNDSTTAQKSSSSVYGEQPRSLNVHWMKYDVTKDDNETSVSSMPNQPARLSPLRERLQARGEQVMQKRQLLTLVTLEEIETKIDEARLRKDYATADALSAQVLARMNRALESKIRHAALLEKANLRHQTEETKTQEVERKLADTKQRQEQIQLRRIKADEVERDCSVNAAKGLQQLNQMNVDLETLIREVYQKIKVEET